MTPLSTSRALWNRSQLDLDSDEVLAQVLDRGDIADWRALYRQAKVDPACRGRIAGIVLRVPLPLPRFWLAALRHLGEEVSLDAVVPPYDAGQV